MIEFWQAKGGGLTPCTLKIRSGCEGGGKGALIQEDKSATLSTLQDQTLFQPMDVDCRNGNLSETVTPIQAAMNHTLNAGGVVACMATQQGGAEIRTDDMAPTLTAAAGMSGNNQPVICIQGNCIDRADTAGCNGKGWTEDVSYMLNTIDRPAVALSVPTGVDLYNGCLTGEVAASLTTASEQGAINTGPSVIAIENYPNDSRVKLSKDNVVQTLSGKMGTGGGQHPNDT